jgi:hypothetical protein
VLGAILKATEKAHGAIVQLGAAEKASFGNFAAAEKVALRDSLKAALREEAGEALASAGPRTGDVGPHPSGRGQGRDAYSAGNGLPLPSLEAS